MFFQLEEAKEVFVCVITLGTDKKVYFVEQGNDISKEYIIENFGNAVLKGGESKFSCFDIKTDYHNILNDTVETGLSSKEIANSIFDCKIAAYLLNPLKNDYEVADVASEYLNITLQTWNELFGKMDCTTAYNTKKDDFISYISKEVYSLNMA